MNAENENSDPEWLAQIALLTQGIDRLSVVSESQLAALQGVTHAERVDALLREAGLPRRAMEALERGGVALPSGWVEARAVVIAQKHGTVLLMGAKGTGKTVLAVSVALALIHERLVRVHYTPLLKLMLRLEAARRDISSESRLAVLQELGGTGLLILDEMDKGFDTESEKRTVFALLDERHNALRPTLLISHPPYASFSEWAGPELVDRINETGGRIKCTWPGMR